MTAAYATLRGGLLGLLRSPSLRTSALLAFTGLGFAGANLIFAKLMEPADYGLLSLAISILNVVVPFAALGLDGIVIRRRLPPSRGLLRAAVRAALGTSVAVAAFAGFVYGLPAPVSVALALGIGLGGVGMVAASVVQSRQAFGSALLVTQNPSLFLILASLVGLVLGLSGILYPIAFVVFGWLLVASWAWRRLLREAPGESGALSFSRREALHYAGLSAAGQLMQQLERLVIPKVLSLEDLAVYAVMAAVVLAPFHTIQMGVSFTVAPRLRAAGSAAERRRVVWREALMLLGVAAVAAGTLYAVAPWIFELLYRGKYVVPQELIVAALGVGVLRFYSGLTKGMAVALCTTRELAKLNVLLWLTLLLAIAGAVVGARWGLAGIVYGIGLGWLARVVLSAALAARHLRD